MPEALRVIFEDIYAQGISHSFLIAVPFAVISLIAIIFLPNKPLTRMTTSERIAGERSRPRDRVGARGHGRRSTATGTRADATDAAERTDDSGRGTRRPIMSDR